MSDGQRTGSGAFGVFGGVIALLFLGACLIGAWNETTQLAPPKMGVSSYYEKAQDAQPQPQSEPEPQEEEEEEEEEEGRAKQPSVREGGESSRIIIEGDFRE